jgi:hypothetical protein
MGQCSTPVDRQAQNAVTAWVIEHIPVDDWQRFINLVHTELKGLHEGNIARFRLRPAEFAVWQNSKPRT